MYPLEQIPEPWRGFLRELDRIAVSTVRLDCIGGFVVTMLYGLDRPTADIDVLEIGPRSIEKIFAQIAMAGGALHEKFGVYLDRVAFVLPPYEYEGRLTEMFPGAFHHLRLMALDPYDLALTKLVRNIERDRSDIRFLARTLPFDLDMLRERYQTELRPYLDTQQREDLTLQLWIDSILEERAAASNARK